jgi:hypothetical protein
MPVADLYESGLGYANVLFLALVVVELANSADADLTLFLVSGGVRGTSSSDRFNTLAALNIGRWGEEGRGTPSEPPDLQTARP